MFSFLEEGDNLMRSILLSGRKILVFFLFIGIMVIILIVLSRQIKQRSIRLERLFLKNLRSRDVAAQVKGAKRPSYASHLIERDLTMAEVTVPPNSLWAGQTLAELQLGRKLGIHVSSILRDGRRLNIPYGAERIFPADRLQVIGSDEQITEVCKALETAVIPDDEGLYEDREMILRQVVINGNSPVLGKALCESGIRERYGLLVVGIEQGQQNLTSVNPNHVFEYGDVVWMVGERQSFEAIGY